IGAMKASCVYAEELPICAPEAPWICPSIELAPDRSKLTGVTRSARDCSSTGLGPAFTSVREAGSSVWESAGTADRTSTQPRIRPLGGHPPPAGGDLPGVPPFVPATRPLTRPSTKCFIDPERKARRRTPTLLTRKRPPPFGDGDGLTYPT